MMNFMDYLVGYRFWVELESQMTAGFTDCTGIQMETEVTDITEGGENNVIYRFPGRARFGNITLKRGFTESPELWTWFIHTLKGINDRRPLTIYLMRPIGTPVRKWSFANAFPVKWSGPELKSDANAVAIESVDFAHEGLLGL